jgi:hypothetical protein
MFCCCCCCCLCLDLWWELECLSLSVLIPFESEFYSILYTFIALIFHNWNSKALQIQSLFKNQKSRYRSGWQNKTNFILLSSVYSLAVWFSWKTEIWGLTEQALCFILGPRPKLPDHSWLCGLAVVMRHGSALLQNVANVLWCFMIYLLYFPVKI